MEKRKAIEMLGGTPGKAAKALGYSAVQTVYQWPDPLPQFLADRVNGAAMRIEKERAQAQASIAQPTTETVAEQGA